MTSLMASSSLGLALAWGAISVSTLAADEQQGPLYVLAGISHRDHSASELVGSYGYYIGFGYLSGSPGLLQSGSAGFDLEWRHGSGKGNRLDSYDFCYSERDFGVADGLYFGYGVGSTYSRLRRTGIGGGTSSGWRLTAKGILGYDLGGGVVMEAAYFISGTIGGANTGGLVLAAGVWF
jgi:hypothetical protein